MGQGHARMSPSARPPRAAPSAPPAPHAPRHEPPTRGAPNHAPEPLAFRPDVATPALHRTDMKSFKEDMEQFSAMLREKEAAQARWLQEQQVEAASNVPLSAAEIEAFSQEMNIRSRPMPETPKKVELTEGSGLVKELAANRRKALSRERTGAAEDAPVVGKLTTAQLQQLLHMHASTWSEKDLAAKFKLEEHIVANITKHYRLLKAEDATY